MWSLASHYNSPPKIVFFYVFKYFIQNYVIPVTFIPRIPEYWGRVQEADYSAKTYTITFILGPMITKILH